MPTQTETGKAFEYALITSLNEKIASQNVRLQDDEFYQTVQEKYQSFNQTEQRNYTNAANTAVDHLLLLEPRLTNSPNNVITLSIQGDESGQEGDPRDVLISRDDGWNIGISAKNNHSAVKHSRLSEQIDFGLEWMGVPCSQEYRNVVFPVFARIRHMREDSQQPIYWRDIPNKAEIYRTVLGTFTEELTRLNTAIPLQIPELLVRYLIGRRDFYKIMKYKNRVRIQGFNLNGTLNQAQDRIRPAARIGPLRLPTQIIQIEYNRQRRIPNTARVYFNEGWQLKFRIHNARSEIEPSLKFDIGLDSTPATLYSQDILYS
jgi:hypothetical protein